MKINFIYGNKVRTLPGTIPDKLLLKASKEQLVVLIHLANNDNVDIVKDSATLKMNVDEFVCALNFWKENNIISFESSNTTSDVKSNVSKPTENTDKPIMSSSELPVFTKKELNNILENNPDTKSLIDCCQQTLGKMFNSAEINIILGMLDYLQLKPEYILLLCDYCCNIDKKSLRYIEKMAIEFVDKGITDYSELESYIEHKRKASNMTSDIQKVLSISDRPLVPLEKECFERWICEWDFNIDIIKKAYEITIVNTGKYSIKYIDKILENWHNLGLKTVKAVDKYIDDIQSSKPSNTKGSFDTNDFFGAALNRAYKKGDK